MRRLPPVVLLLASWMPLSLQAQNPILDEAVTTTLPTKGMSMQAVTQAFGEPAARHAAVGGGSAQQPPITRWDYSDFSVFFERGTVIDAVRPDAPAPVHRQEELARTSP